MSTTKTLENDNITGVNNTGSHANTPLKYLTSSSITGNKIYNAENEKLGEVKDLMLNIATGKIEYVIIEFGGILVTGKKYFSVPFTALKVDTERHAFILNQKKEVLENAPGFDKDHWPDTNSHEFETYSYWGGFMGSSTIALTLAPC